MSIIENGPIFIGGVSRSGKTLLSALLSLHSNIAIPPKGTNLWNFFLNKYGDLNWKHNFERCLSDMLRYRHIRCLDPNPNRIRKEFSLGQRSYSNLFALFHRHYADRLGKPRWGVQSGFIEAYSKVIFQEFPRAKMIHLIRDPRDRFASLILMSPEVLNKIGPNTANWIYSVYLAQKNSKRYSENYKIVLYEKLVLYPEETLRDIGIFLNESFSSTCSEFTNAPEFLEKHGRLTQNYIGHYPNILSKSDIAFIQRFSKRYMLANGYELETIRFPVNTEMVIDFKRRITDFTHLTGWMLIETLRLKFPSLLSRTIASKKIQPVSGNISE